MKSENIAVSNEELLDLLEGDDVSLRAYFDSLSHAGDIIEFFDKAPYDQWPRLLKLIDDPDKRAEVISESDHTKWRDLLKGLNPAEIAELTLQMESDDATDLIADLPPFLQIEILHKYPLKERYRVQQLLHYPEDSAGGLMQLELAAVSDQAQVADAVQTVRALVDEEVEVLGVWVVDRDNRLVGYVQLVDLLLHKTTTPIQSIMDRDVVTVTPYVDQEQVIQLFKKYDLITLPVVDDFDRLMGRIVIDDVVDVLEEAADEEALRMGGISAEEIYHRQEVFSTARIRIPWLAIALMSSMVSASLLKFYEPLLEQVAAVFAFLPVIMAMGGNVGTQTATTLIRGLATNKLQLSDMPKFLFKEIRVGLVLGVLYGLGAGLVATFILSQGNYYLGLIVFVAMVCAMVTAATMGVIAPAMLKKFDFDPAISSGPFVTSLNDISGILIYMAIAGLFLSHLK